MTNIQSNATKIQQLTGVGLLAATIVVIQAISTFTPMTIPLNLVLPTIVIGAAMYGAKAGLFLGLCFGAVVMVSGISGAAPLSLAMWTASPVLFIIVTLGRGAAQGFVAGVVYKALSKRNVQDGVLGAAIVAPIVNTGIFLGVLILLFQDILVGMAGDTNIIYHAFIVMAGTNFLIEMAVNIALVTVIARIITIVKDKRHRG